MEFHHPIFILLSTVTLLSRLSSGESVKPYFVEKPSGPILKTNLDMDYGKWHPKGFHMCGKDKYVFGMQLMLDDSKSYDRRGLLGIKLLCGNFKTKYYETDERSYPHNFSWIDSTVSRRQFRYGYKYKCDGPAVAFDVQALKYQGFVFGEDDTATNNIKLICGKASTLTGDGDDRGRWVGPFSCPPKTALCGLKTQVEDYKVFHATGKPHVYTREDMSYKGLDTTGLNNVQMTCCDIENPLNTCTPVDTVDDIFSCINVNYSSPVDCTYRFKYGVSNTAAMTSTIKYEMGFSVDIGFTNEQNVGAVKNTIETKLGFSTKTAFDWSATSSSMWATETEYTLNVKAPYGKRVTLYQPRASCSFLSVRANSYYAKEFDVFSTRADDDEDVEICPSGYVSIDLEEE